MGKANVMLSYPIDEAEVLLDSKLKAAKLSLSNCEEDMDFLREQITVMGSHALVHRSGGLLTMGRLWRWLSLGCTTGMSCISVRRRRRRRRRSRKGRVPRLHERESCRSGRRPPRGPSATQLVPTHNFAPGIPGVPSTGAWNLRDG